MASVAKCAATSFRDRVNTQEGLVDRAIFSEDEVYRVELDKIFARAWLFMCHASQLPEKGDFFQSFMGEERVIVTRSRSGEFEVLLNACRHRGALVCRANAGNAPSFTCAYHGWTYDLSGNLIGVPGLTDLYEKSLDRDAWGLRKAAQVSSYRGFIFATLDPEAPPLDEFLGEAGKAMIDKLADYGDVEVVPGIIRHRLKANWKIGVENDQDYYHVGISHASLLDAYGMSRSEVHTRYWQNNEGPSVMGEYGHTTDLMTGHYHATIFPHMSMLTDLLQVVIVRHPKGPREMEMWYFTFVDKNASAEDRKMAIDRNNSRLGPTGMVEQDDGENWEFCTIGANSHAMRDVPFNYQMGLGAGTTGDSGEVGYPLYTGPRTTEEYARWRLKCWAEWMDADSWPDLQAHHSKPGAK
ncbi:MAG: SRPBCC family protein [Sphingobium sp.]|uniref:aromatic ring-hydroxylating oxygenase subunit alpha n=1 Tax=Sphingobium sp. TaxID=1912891 RepID=UPI0029ADAC94|nr:SRPBCC family protein [Sphingobium sp.]MDX3910850.1 SRPBCC family protein [Sphingobium sp.]